MKKITVLALLLFHLFASAQNYYDDAQIWGEIYLEKKLNKKFDVHLDLQGRFINNVSQLGRARSDIGVGYKITKNIKVTAAYRYVQKRNKDDSYRTRHQYYVALILKKNLGRWRFSYRNRFQSRYNVPGDNSDVNVVQYYDRNKITIRYEATKRFSFYVAEEVYIPINNPQLTGLSQSRSFAGTHIKVTKRQQIELYFMYQVQLQKGDWYTQDDDYSYKPLKRNFVYGIGYSIEF